jgi:hypothetical protein
LQLAPEGAVHLDSLLQASRDKKPLVFLDHSTQFLEAILPIFPQKTWAFFAMMVVGQIMEYFPQHLQEYISILHNKENFSRIPSY